LIGICAVVLGLSAAHANPSVYLFTGQSGAQTQIDVNHTTEWTVSFSSDLDLLGGELDMKDGSQTGSDGVLGNLYLTVYEGATQVAQRVMTNTEFVTAHVSNDQSFNGPGEYTPVLFDTPVTLLAGHSYTIDLTSPEIDAQSHAYFIKGFDTAFIGDTQGTPIVGGEVAPVTEPESIALFAAGLAGIAVSRRRGSFRNWFGTLRQASRRTFALAAS